MSIPVPKYTLYDRKDIEVLVAYILYKVGSITKDELMRISILSAVFSIWKIRVL